MESFNPTFLLIIILLLSSLICIALLIVIIKVKRGWLQTEKIKVGSV